METICVCRGHEGLYQQARLNLKVGYFLGKYKLGQGGGGWGGARSSVYTDRRQVFTSFECIQTGDKCKFLKFCVGDRGGDQA